MPGRTDGPLVLCPLGVEALSVRLGLRGGHVVRAGLRARRRAAVRSALRVWPSAPVVVVGVAAATTEAACPGDLVVPDVVRSPAGTRRCPSAGSLAAVLRDDRRVRSTVHTGALVESPRLVRHVRADADAVALDMESGLLLDLVDDGREVAVLRAVVDTPRRPLLSVATVAAGAAALAALRACGPALRTWAATVARGKNDSVVKEVRQPWACRCTRA
ncbi:hypothetical protein [Saccharomonospora sp. NB11]|uniref:hypothetical protein n=1 Tax=Saccharomonospora sp. NB11 TaxID=1642298 RepID=UPI0018D1833B|nr:hypothetical protein [Saccharomonospora sp. NB11]